MFESDVAYHMSGVTSIAGLGVGLLTQCHQVACLIDRVAYSQKAVVAQHERLAIWS